MKKLFALTVIFALVLAACGDGDSTDNGNNGTTTTTTMRIRNQSSKTISDVVWNSISFFPENADIRGTWKGNAGSSGFITGAINLVVGSNTYTLSTGHDNDSGTWTRNGNNFTFQSSQPLGYKCRGILSAGKLTLNVLNFMGTSSMGTFELTSNDLDLSINSGASVSKTVEDGSGYIFFSVGPNAFRTSELIAVEKNKKTDFNFIDSTLVVQINGPNNPITLGGL